MTRDSIFQEIQTAVDNVNNKLSLLAVEFGDQQGVEDMLQFVNNINQMLETCKNANLSDTELKEYKNNILKNAQQLIDVYNEVISVLQQQRR